MAVPKDYYSSDRTRHGKNYAILYGATKEEVEEKIRRYFDAYPSQGYSTYVDLKPTRNEEYGYWFARVGCWNNCG